jgi:hypothetical protein
VNICLHSGRVIEALGISMWQCLQEQGKYWFCKLYDSGWFSTPHSC